jgi:preprotein translocase subunit SecG
MSLFIFLTVLQAIVAAALVGIILMQKSEGGGLGLGGGGAPGGMLSARGAGDFLTRTTAILAILFVVLSIALAAVATSTSSNRAIETTLDRNVAPAQQAIPADPLAAPEAAGDDAPAPAPAEDDPLAGVAD